MIFWTSIGFTTWVQVNLELYWRNGAKKQTRMGAKKKKKKKKYCEFSIRISWVFMRIVYKKIAWPLSRLYNPACIIKPLFKAMSCYAVMLCITLHYMYVQMYHDHMIFSKLLSKRLTDRNTNYWYVSFFMFYHFFNIQFPKIGAYKRQTIKEKMFRFFHDKNKINRYSNRTSSFVSFWLFMPKFMNSYIKRK